LPAPHCCSLAYSRCHCYIHPNRCSLTRLLLLTPCWPLMRLGCLDWVRRSAACLFFQIYPRSPAMCYTGSPSNRGSHTESSFWSCDPCLALVYLHDLCCTKLSAPDRRVLCSTDQACSSSLSPVLLRSRISPSQWLDISLWNGFPLALQHRYCMVGKQ